MVGAKTKYVGTHGLSLVVEVFEDERLEGNGICSLEFDLLVLFVTSKCCLELLVVLGHDVPRSLQGHSIRPNPMQCARTSHNNIVFPLQESFDWIPSTNEPVESLVPQSLGFVQVYPKVCMTRQLLFLRLARRESTYLRSRVNHSEESGPWFILRADMLMFS